MKEKFSNKEALVELLTYLKSKNKFPDFETAKLITNNKISYEEYKHVRKVVFRMKYNVFVIEHRKSIEVIIAMLFYATLNCILLWIFYRWL